MHAVRSTRSLSVRAIRAFEYAEFRYLSADEIRSLTLGASLEVGGAAYAETYKNLCGLHACAITTVPGE